MLKFKKNVGVVESGAQLLEKLITIVYLKRRGTALSR